MKSLNKVVRVAISPISDGSVFYLSLVALFSISIISIEYGNCSRLRAGLEMFSDVYLICALVSVLPSTLRRLSKYFLFILFFFVGLTDILCYHIMGVAIVPTVFQTWLQTNGQEATEVLSSYFPKSLMSVPVLLLLALPFVSVWLRRHAVCIPAKMALVLLVLTVISFFYGIENKCYLYHVFTRTSDDDMKEFVEYHTMTHEYLPIYRLCLSVKEMGRFSVMRESLLRHAITTHADSCTYESPIIVLVIGESYNRHHSSLYGYSYETTPVQQRLQREGSLYCFTDVISSYNLTFKSFQNMLTLYDYDSNGRWYDYPMVTALFKSAGYEVDFFSNQYTLDKSSAFTDYTEDVFMNNHQITKYQFDKRNTKSHAYDMDLLNDFHDAVDLSDEHPRLVIFHFLGIHEDFSLRYPDAFRKYLPSDYDRQDLTSDMRQTLAHYDNAILYNDSVLGAIVDAFKDRDAVIIHVPDHGELVYDDCQECGRNLQLSKKYVVPQFDIPFWIYCSEKYREAHPTISRQIANAVHRPFMTDDLPHLLLYLGGVKCKEYVPEKNLIDSLFNSNRKRVICGEADYDEVCK